VAGASVVARRVERRALHRRSTNVRGTRTVRRGSGSLDGRHPGCLRGRE
jgi:hypothetical protein